MLYAIVWGLHKAGRRCIESSARRNPSRDLGRIWDRFYGAVLVLVGILLGAFVAHQLLTVQSEPLLILVVRLSLASFVAVGAVAIGFQRMTGRSLGTIEKLVKPDDWLLEKLGPKGSHWAREKETPDDREASRRDR